MAQVDFLYTKPSTRAAISAWTDVYLGFKIHDKTVCEGHNSQLDYVAGGFLSEFSSCVYMASRNAGKSYAAAVLNILDCWFKPGIHCAVAAYKRDQSDYIYTYMLQFLDVLSSRIGKKLWKATKDEILFDKGSSVKFFSGGKSTAGIKGYHPDILQVDEGDLFTQEQFDGISFALEAAGKYQRRFDVLSTNYRVSGEGVILKQIERYEEYNRTKNVNLKPKKVFRTCLLDVLAKCDDRFECLDEKTNRLCPLWAYCKGRAKDSSGFYKIDSALETTGDASRQQFESQYLLLRPSSEFTYFHNFDSSKNICDPDRAYDPSLLTLVHFDFGGSRCAHAWLVVQKSADGVYYAIDEYTWMGQLEAGIARLKALYPQATTFDCFIDVNGGKTENIKGAMSYETLLKQQGFFPRKKQLKRDPTFQLVYNLIDPADGKIRLMVNKRCKELIKQIYAAECKTNRGRPTTEPADITPDDVLDCLRNIVGWTSGSYAKHNGRRHLQWF